MLDCMTIPVSTIIALIVSFIALIVSGINLILRDLIRVNIVFENKRHIEMLGLHKFTFEVRNLSYMPVSLANIRFALCKSGKKGVIHTAFDIDNSPSLPRRLEPRTSVVVSTRFGDQSTQEKIVEKLEKQGYFYVFIYTSCGKSKCRKAKLTKSEITRIGGSSDSQPL